MALNISTDIKAQVAFKNLLGKSQTDDTKEYANEGIGISFDVPAFGIMLDDISPTASDAVQAGVAVKVVATLTVKDDSNNKAFLCYWPSSPPAGADVKNSNQPFQYGVGSLEGINAGDRLTNMISEAFGVQYQARPFDGSGNKISELDDRLWVFQYNSGVFYQSNVNPVPTPPATIEVYYYIGNRLSSLSKNTQTNIRVSATGSVSTTGDSYFATYSTPMISGTYSKNFLFLVDFNNTNLSGTVSFNVNNIGTFSVIKYTADGPVPLTPGDIRGATGGTAGQIYYMIYNNGFFEFYQKNPLSEASKFTNPNDTTKTVGGIERGTSFDKVALQDVFTDLLYSDPLGNITNFTLANTLTQYEVGQSLSKGVYTFSWTSTNPGDFKTASLLIKDVTNVTTTQTYWVQPSATPFTQSGDKPSGIFTASFGATISSSISNIRTFKISLSRLNGTVVSKFLDIPWMWKVYHGSSTFSTLTASGIFNLGGTLASQSFGSWTLSGSGYKYLAFPNESAYDFGYVYHKGLPFALAGTSSGFTNEYGDVNYSLMTITNSYSIGKEYKIYRSKNQISATISVNLS